jgi:subtilisin family serine protease
MLVRFVVLFGVIATALSAPLLSAQSVSVQVYQNKPVTSAEILVKFRANMTSMQAMSQDADIASAEPMGRTGAVLLRSRGRDVTALLQAYNARPDVLYAEPNYVGRFTDLPNDALFAQQWGLRNTGQVIQNVEGNNGVDIGAAAAWDITAGSRNNVVGLLDSGVDYTHPDLAANIWSAPAAFTVTINGQTITCAAGTHGFNAMTRTCDPMDYFGHGTHVAGIIGAAGNNGLGVSGVNRVASIMGLKLGDATFTVKDAIAALEFAQQVKALFPAAANIRVMNASWGVPFSQTLMDEINLVNGQDVLFVAAAGNAAINNDLTAVYPANYAVPGIVSVAATDNRDALASFSQWGPTAVDLGAPGVNIMSTLIGGAYGFNSGTSMATPMVTGAAALVLAVCPLTTIQLKSTLMNSVDPIPALAERTLSGGRLNVQRALTACAPAVEPTFRLTVLPGLQNVEVTQPAVFTVGVTSFGGFSGSVNLDTTGLPVGMTATFSPPSVTAGAGISTLTIVPGAGTASGAYAVGVVGTRGLTQRTAGLVLGVGVVPSIGVGQTVSGTLTAGDRKSQGVGHDADIYTLSLSETTSVDIDLKSTLFNPYLYLLSSSGSVLYSNDNAQNSNARITATLDSGVYTVEATTANGLGGRYTLSVNTPTISSVFPRIIARGGSALVTLTGTRFSAPMSIDAGSGITVTNVTVVSSTTATATFSLAADATPGPRDFTVTTGAGVSNPMVFPIPAPIEVGQTVSGSVSSTDTSWPNTLYRYTDVHQLTIDAETQGAITISVISSGFDSQLGVFNSTGSVIAANNNGGGADYDRLTTTLNAGVYFLEVTSVINQALGDYTLSTALSGLTGITPRFIEQGTSSSVTLTGGRFAAPMTIDAGLDVMASDIVVGSTSATATLVATTDALTGDRVVRVTTPSGTTNSVPLKVVPPIPTIVLGTPVQGSLSATDPTGYFTPDARMDLYRFTLTANARLDISMESAAFDTQLVIRNATNFSILLSPNDGDGTTNVRTTTFMAAGTYIIEATSFLDRQEGAYQLSLALATLNLASLAPRFGGRGYTVNLSLSGVGLASILAIDAGAGVTVSNVVASETTATATLTIAADAAPGARDLRVVTLAGSSNALSFTVFDIPTIALGDTRSGFLTPVDPATPSRAGQYGDLYRLTLSAPTPVAIAVDSSSFNAFVYVTSISGGVLASDDSGGGGQNARVTTNLAAGSYFIEVTSSSAGLGNYTVSAALNPLTLNFPRALSPADLPLTGFAIVNPGPTAAAVAFTMRDETGSVIATADEVIPARGQLARLGSELFPSAFRTGWVQAASETVGLQGLWLGGDWVNFTDGAEAAPENPANASLILPLVTPLTEVHVANLSTATSSLTFSIFRTTGALLASSVTRNVPAQGVFRSTLAELFPTANLANAATVRVVGSQRLAALSVTSDYPEGPSWTILNAVNASSPTTQANFPHVVHGLQGATTWTSIVGITNLHSFQSQTVSLIFTPLTGAPVTVTRTIPAMGALRESAGTLFNLSSGFVAGSVRATGTLPLTGFIAYGFDGVGSAAVVPVQATARTSMIFAHVANGPGWSTGLALLNTTTTTANVQIYVMRRSGTLVGLASVTLEPGANLAKLVTELVPAAAHDDGFVYVRTTNGVPIYGLELFFSRDVRVMANVAAGVIDPLITYIPPVPAF